MAVPSDSLFAPQDPHFFGPHGMMPAGPPAGAYVQAALEHLGISPEQPEPVEQDPSAALAQHLRSISLEGLANLSKPVAETAATPTTATPAATPASQSHAPALTPQDWALIAQYLHQQAAQQPWDAYVPKVAPRQESMNQSAPPPVATQPQPQPQPQPRASEDFLAQMNSQVAANQSPMIALLASMANDLDQPRRRRPELEMPAFRDYANQWRT